MSEAKSIVKTENVSIKLMPDGGYLASFENNDDGADDLVDFIISNHKVDSALQQQNTALQQQVKDLQAEKSRYSMSAGAADQFRAEALASREALGFSRESECVSPSDISSTIAEIKSAAIREFKEKLISDCNSMDSLIGIAFSDAQGGESIFSDYAGEYANTLSSKGGD